MNPETPWRELPTDLVAPPIPARRSPAVQSAPVGAEPLWFKDAVFYELRVRSFCDGNGDGIGDFEGLTGKLDYLQDLGVTTLWLLPFYPSPLRDDGYDISDYVDVHPDCGTLSDFKVFLKEAHRRGLKVVTELVLNHTSDQHAWFQRARRVPPGNRNRDFYVWSDTADRYSEARVIFQDFERSNWTWDPVAKAYFWHRFYSHQPDLNFDNPAVRKAMIQILDFWLGLGVDGLRLDAVPYLFERDGTYCENLPETHAFLRDLRSHVDRHFPSRMLLAEANQWPEDAAAYLAGGDECHMAFHFPIMPRLFMSLHMEDRFPITDILAQTPALPETCQWALFLRNHDELTLEMVTDEERDTMYQVYARDARMRVNLGIRRRLAPLLSNDRRTIELLNGLLFSLPGTPVLYYGDEIGMGDNVYLGDRNGVRTPMQWSPDRNAGFSRANAQQLYLPVIVDPEHHYEAVNVEAQQLNPTSLLWWSKRIIALRKQFKAFGRGTIEFLHPDNPRVLAFTRQYQNELILVVANLSRFAQHVGLDLERWRGRVPVELFGRTPFPAVGDTPYSLAMGPHGFYWFSLQERTDDWIDVERRRPPTLVLRGGPTTLFRGEEQRVLEALLARYLPSARWFGGKAKGLKRVGLSEVVPLRAELPPASLALLQCEYEGSASETYAMPLAVAIGAEAERVRAEHPKAVVATVQAPSGEGAVYDAMVDRKVQQTLLEALARGRPLRGTRGEVTFVRRPAFRDMGGQESLAPRLLGAEQSNSSVIFGDRLVLKLIRRLEPGVNPELEIGQHLAKRGFLHAPPLAAAVEYRAGRGEPMTLAVVHAFLPNHGDAWQYTLDEIQRYLEHAIAKPLTEHPAPTAPGDIVGLLAQEPPASAAELIGPYLGAARLLGRRTAELHRALCEGEEPGFSTEAYTTLYRRSVYQSMRNNAARALRLLRRGMGSVPAELRGEAQRLLDHENALLHRFERFLKHRLSACRTRLHGDLHLGQVLYTGKDFAIIDFEGEPARPLSDRRRKRSPLRDVAGMLRSFHYAAYTAVERGLKAGLVSAEGKADARGWASLWQVWTSREYLASYLEVSHGATFVPGSHEELRIMLDAFLIDKAVYEIGYELNNRPSWTAVPVDGLLQLLAAPLPAP